MARAVCLSLASAGLPGQYQRILGTPETDRHCLCVSLHVTFCARQSDASTAQPLDKLMTRTNHSLTQHSRNQLQRVKHTFNEKQQNYGAYSPTFRKFSPPSDFFWKTVVKILATTWTRVAGGAVMPAKWRLHSKPRLRLRSAHDAP